MRHFDDCPPRICIDLFCRSLWKSNIGIINLNNCGLLIITIQSLASPRDSQYHNLNWPTIKTHLFKSGIAAEKVAVRFKIASYGFRNAGDRQHWLNPSDLVCCCLFNYSFDSQMLAVTRGSWQHDVVLISDLNRK